MVKQTVNSGGRAARAGGLLACALLLAAGGASAQNAVRGKQLYESKLNPSYLSCSDAGTCHGPNPADNLRKLRNGSNPAVILSAMNSVPLMGPLRAFTSSTDAADMAAYIANPAAATAGSISASGSTLSFATTQVGATSTASMPVSITVTNFTGSSVNITGIGKSGTNAADFTVSGTCVSATPLALAAGATCSLSATFMPGGAGTRTATLAVQSTATTNPMITLSGMGSASPIASITLNRTSIAFPTQTIATTSVAQDVVITNLGTAPLTITAFTTTPSPEFSSFGNCAGTIVVGGSCSVVVVFTPAAAGQRSGNVAVTTNLGMTDIPIAGNSVLTPTPIVDVDSNSMSFAAALIGSSPAAQAFALTNSGNAPLQITDVTLAGPDAKEFSMTTGTTCKAGALAALASCRIELAFKPQSGGGKSANVTVAHNGSGGSTKFDATATATVAVAPVSSSSALYPSNIGGGGAFSLMQLLALALGLLAAPALRRRV